MGGYLGVALVEEDLSIVADRRSRSPARGGYSQSRRKLGSKEEVRQDQLKWMK